MIAVLLAVCMGGPLGASSSPVAERPSVTIYNQEFGVVREAIRLDLKAGENPLSFSGITAHLEPDSVVLRDPAGRRMLRIIEQNYRADPVSQELLLQAYEGKTLSFRVERHGEPPQIVTGRLIRAPYVVHQSGLLRYSQEYQMRQSARAYNPYSQTSNSPIVEVDGEIRFALPGAPIFPSLTDDSILKPTLDWLIETDRDGPIDAELSYVTGGMSWEAAYNVVASTKGDVLDIVGWVTMDNQSGRTFERAAIKLIAGDVNKLRDADVGGQARFLAESRAGGNRQVSATEKSFDEYHMYTLSRPTTLRDRETKQIELLRATGVSSQRLYVYDGAKIDRNRYSGYAADSARQDQQYGTLTNPKVWVMQEFVNTEANNLGIPLPRGRLRFYRRDDDGRLEFTGENVIDHTPRNEKVRVYTGDAFDLVGERRQTQFNVDTRGHWVDETFEIKVRNRKSTEVEVRVVETLYRWHNWDIADGSQPFTKLNSNTIEFRVTVPPDGEQTITYKVHYSW